MAPKTAQRRVLTIGITVALTAMCFIQDASLLSAFQPTDGGVSFFQVIGGEEGKETVPSQVEYYNDEVVDPDYLSAYLEDINSTENIWNREPTMPKWLKAYFSWHKLERAKLAEEERRFFANVTNEQREVIKRVQDKSVQTMQTHDIEHYRKLVHPLVSSRRWMVMSCVHGLTKKCGGTADRIKNLPIALFQAYRQKRMYFIFWTRPDRIEAFWMPPANGLDWRTPLWMEPMIKSRPRTGEIVGSLGHMEEPRSKNLALLRIQFQLWDAGRLYYDSVVATKPPTKIKDMNATVTDETQTVHPQLMRQPAFEEVYHIIWKASFTPVLPIQKIIREELQSLQLTPGKYVGAHLRALHARESRPNDHLQQMGANAANCATKVAPGRPIFMASDSTKAIELTKDYTRKKIQGFPNSTSQYLVSRDPLKVQNLHMDFGPPNATAEQYYDGIIDLYLLALGGCGTFNVGGYGHWAVLIGGHSNCSYYHTKLRGNGARMRMRNKCSWTESPDPVDLGSAENQDYDYKSMFLPSMAEIKSGDTITERYGL